MKKIRAFTLLETIIVISVFCIGILVVLHGLSQTLRNKDYANTQIKSAFFAREWIEMVFNLRDANYHKKLPWNCIFQWDNHVSHDWCDANLEPWTILKISLWTDDGYIYAETGSISSLDFDDILSDYQIYLHTWNVLNGVTWYYYDYTWDEEEETWFARYLLITWVSADWVNIEKDKLLKIESHVLYKRWALTWEKVMETFIWNYEFKQ